MKRLKKNAIALNNVNKFIDNWANDWKNIDQQLVDQLIRENQDCLYSGTVYRFLQMDLINTFRRSLFPPSEFKKLGYVPGEKIEEVVRNEIGINDKYYSSAKETKGVYRVITDLDYGDGVIISFNTQNSLDFEALIKKYENDITYYDQHLLVFVEEREVITKVPSNFKIEVLRISRGYYTFGHDKQWYNIPYDRIWF